MVATIIYLVISLLVSLIFVILGLKQYKSKTPVTINTGEKTPREEELTSVTEWNHRHGRNFVILGCMSFVTLSVFVFCLDRFENIIIQMVVFLLAIFGEIAWVVIEDSAMKKRMIKK